MHLKVSRLYEMILERHIYIYIYIFYNHIPALNAARLFCSE